MNDFAEMSYKIIFLGLLAVLISMSLPVWADDPGNVGGPGATTIFEGRGALAPLPVPDSQPTPEPALDTTPADEVRSLPAAETPESTENPVQTAENPEKTEEKPWWRFW